MVTDQRGDPVGCGLVESDYFCLEGEHMLMCRTGLESGFSNGFAAGDET